MRGQRFSSYDQVSKSAALSVEYRLAGDEGWEAHVAVGGDLAALSELPPVTFVGQGLTPQRAQADGLSKALAWLAEQAEAVRTAMRGLQP